MLISGFLLINSTQYKGRQVIHNMKIKKEHYEHIKQEIQNLVSAKGKETIAEYKKDLLNDTRIKDINVRFRWDLLHAANLDSYVCNTLYINEGLHDTHIDTALKHIVKELCL